MQFITYLALFLFWCDPSILNANLRILDSTKVVEWNPSIF